MLGEPFCLEAVEAWADVDVIAFDHSRTRYTPQDLTERLGLHHHRIVKFYQSGQSGGTNAIQREGVLEETERGYVIRQYVIEEGKSPFDLSAALLLPECKELYSSIVVYRPDREGARVIHGVEI